MALGDWFRKWREQRLYERQAQARLGQQIDTVIDAVDPRLRMLIGYRQRLDPALRHALQVADTLYAALPPPLEVAHTRWSQEPLLRASFTTPEAIQELFDNHRVLRRFLSSAKARGATTIYAGLGMSLQLSKRFGHMLQGDVVQREVAQQVLLLGDHRLSAFATSLEALEAQVRERLLQELAMRSTQAVFGARMRKESLTEERTKLRMRLRLYEQEALGLATFWHGEELIERHTDELRKKLAAAEHELGELQESAADIDDFLDMTVETFSSAGKDTRLEKRIFHLDNMNIHHDGPGPGIAEVPMALLHIAKRPPRVIRLIRFSPDLVKFDSRDGLRQAARALGVH